jgi:hypothetical protein
MRPEYRPGCGCPHSALRRRMESAFLTVLVCLRRVLDVAIRDRDVIASVLLQKPYIFHFKTIHKMYFKRFLIFNLLNQFQ